MIRARTAGGLPLVLFDYSYDVHQTSGPKSTSSTHRVPFAVAAVDLPGPLPELLLAPESFFSRVAGKLGFSGIETGVEAFDRRFRVRADDEADARGLLSPEVVEFLLSQRLDSWEIVGDQLVVARDGQWDLDDYDRLAAKLQEFVDLVPDDRWGRRGGA